MNKSGVRPRGNGGKSREGADRHGAGDATGASAARRQRQRRLSFARAVCAGLLSMGVAGAMAGTLAGCGAPNVTPFDPRTLERSYRSGATAGEFAAPQTRTTLPTTLQATTTERPVGGPVPPGALIVRLPLQEIIQRAAANNKEARVAGYEPSIEETREIEAEARFDPAFFLSGNLESQRVLSPSGGIVPDPFQPRTFDTLSGQAGIRQNLPTGAQFEASYRVQKIHIRDASGAGNIPVPTYYLDEFILRVTQPLLRDFGTEVNRARITISRNNRRISLLEFRRTLEQQLFDTERVYWQLVQAEREVNIQQDLLDQSLRTYQIILNRFEAGLDVSRVQVSQAASFVEGQRAVLVRAQSRVRELSHTLKRFMNDPDFPAAGAVYILPGDTPIEGPIQFNEEELIDAALSFRLELGQQILRIRTAEITQEVARNNLLPQLNFTGSLQIQGAGLNVGQALKDQRQWEDISSSLGLEMEIPIGNRAARAIYRRVELQRLQAMEQYAGLIDTIVVDVRTALLEIETSWAETVQRQQARFAAQDAMLAIQQRVEADEPLTPEFVQLQLQAQERFAREAALEAAALTGYNTALARLEQAKGTLLRYNNVLMVEEGLPSRR